MTNATMAALWLTLQASTFLRTLAVFAVAFVLGLAIGLERQWRQRNAGLRTNVLVAVGAAAFADLGQRLNGPVGATSLTAYIISGIGFLGARPPWVRSPAAAFSRKPRR